MTQAVTTTSTDNDQLQQLMINTIRTLAIDAVQKANSGHPGAPLGMASMGYTLFTQFLRFNPKDPDWPNRDRFILSAGHASMLQYALLYLTGYDLTLDDIKQFRQWGSKTAGHPEYRLCPGVETSTGPLGQGFGNGVGMAIAQAYLASYFNRPGYDIFDYHVYGIVSDGDLEEGVTSEDASLAGHLQLGRIIYLYDRNRVQLSGPTEVTFTEDVLQRFQAYGWHTQEVTDGNDIGSIAKAIQNAKDETQRPSLIAVDTIIGYGSPEEGTYKVHGEPLGPEGVRETKQALGWPPDEQFYVPQEALYEFRKSVPRGRQLQEDWNQTFSDWKKEFPDLAAEFELAREWKVKDGWKDSLPTWSVTDPAIATREASGKAMNAIAPHVPTFIGGDADLAPSTKSLLNDYGVFEPGSHNGRNIKFGVREHAMGSITNGMTANGFLWPYGATFFTFSDYQRPAVRLASIMHIPNIFLYTHDSVLLGEDGPTHQPIEQLMSLRCMPNLVTIRPADANETAEAWSWMIENRAGPMAIVLSRQKTPILDRSRRKGDLHQGAYILEEAEGGAPDIILMGTGTEVALCVAAREELSKQGIKARVVSFPSWEIFKQQPKEYQRSVFPPDVKKRLSVEAGVTLGWCTWVGDEGGSVGINDFGASAPLAEIQKHLGFNVEHVVKHARELLGRDDNK